MPQDKELPEKSHSEQLQDNGIYVFMGDVDADSVQPIIEWILVENHVSKKKKKDYRILVITYDLNKSIVILEDKWAANFDKFIKELNKLIITENKLVL